MPAQPQRHRPKPNEPEPVEIRIRVDGKLYVFRAADASAEDSSALRRATGMSLNGLLHAAYEDLDIDVVAAIVWLVRRRDEPRLRWEAVAKEIGYTTPLEWENPDERKGASIRAISDSGGDEASEDGSVDPTVPAS